MKYKLKLCDKSMEIKSTRSPWASSSIEVSREVLFWEGSLIFGIELGMGFLTFKMALHYL